MPKKAEYVRFKKYDRKIKSPFMIYAELESTLVLEDSGRQDRNESYNVKNMLLVNQDGFMTSVVSFLSHTQVQTPFTIFINSMSEESKHCADVMKTHFNKQLVITKEDDEDLKVSTKC